MRVANRTPWHLLLWAAVLTIPAPAPGQEATSVVFLVRHAEKVDDSADPSLSAQGLQRARLLAGMLADAGVTHIFSSDFERTRDTAAPLAERLDIEVELYDPRGLDALAARLRSTPGRHLVVGHSNTTPELTGLLGGEPGSPIVEASEYDRLYILFLSGTGAETVLTRFGSR